VTTLVRDGAHAAVMAAARAHARDVDVAQGACSALAALMDAARGDSWEALKRDGENIRAFLQTMSVTHPDDDKVQDSCRRCMAALLR